MREKSQRFTGGADENLRLGSQAIHEASQTGASKQTKECQWPPDAIFIPVETSVHYFEGGGSSDIVNLLDAFNREGAQLFEINSRILYEVLFPKKIWHLASMLSRRECPELEGWLM